jgi:hypothetical protein
MPSKALLLGGAALRATASVTDADASITGPITPGRIHR